MIWCGGVSDLLCCVFVWVNSIVVCGSAELYWDIGSSSSSTHSDIVVGMLLLLLLTVFAVSARLFGEIIHYFLLLPVPWFFL